MESDVDRLLSVSKLKKSSILAKYIGKFFFIIKNKSRKDRNGGRWIIFNFNFFRDVSGDLLPTA